MGRHQGSFVDQLGDGGPLLQEGRHSIVFIDQSLLILNKHRRLLDSSVDRRRSPRLDACVTVLPLFADQHRMLAFDLIRMGGCSDLVALPRILNVKFLFYHFNLILIANMHNNR